MGWDCFHHLYEVQIKDNKGSHLRGLSSTYLKWKTLPLPHSSGTWLMEALHVALSASRPACRLRSRRRRLRYSYWVPASVTLRNLALASMLHLHISCGSAAISFNRSCALLKTAIQLL